MNGNYIASTFKVTIRILFVFGRIIVLIICIRPNSKDPLFGTAVLLVSHCCFGSCYSIFRFTCNCVATWICFVWV